MTTLQKLSLAFAVFLLVAQLVLTAGLIWRTYQGEKLVTMRTEAFEGVVVLALQEAYDTGRRSCASPRTF